MSQLIARILAVTLIVLAGFIGLARPASAAALSSNACQLDYPWQVPGNALCIQVNGTGTYVSTVSVGYVTLHADTSFTAYYVIKTWQPAASGTWAFITGVYTAGGVLPERHWVSTPFIIDKYVGLDYHNRVPHNYVCVAAYSPATHAMVGGWACAEIL
jgi:hypothetical protein